MVQLTFKTMWSGVEWRWRGIELQKQKYKHIRHLILLNIYYNTIQERTTIYERDTIFCYSQYRRRTLHSCWEYWVSVNIWKYRVGQNGKEFTQVIHMKSKFNALYYFVFCLFEMSNQFLISFFGRHCTLISITEI